MPSVTRRKSGKAFAANGAGASTALLLIDVLSTFDYQDGHAIARRLQRHLWTLKGLAIRARAAGAPVIYVNDNWGHWRSQQSALVDQALHGRSPGAEIARELRPLDSDYFVLKPRHSGFYGTPLDFLLKALEVRRLVLGGVATNSCIWLTAADAHVREYDVVVVKDGTAAMRPSLERDALQLMKETLDVRILAARRISFPGPGAKHELD